MLTSIRRCGTMVASTDGKHIWNEQSGQSETVRSWSEITDTLIHNNGKKKGSIKVANDHDLANHE